jgi:hypothetical protein
MVEPGTFMTMQFAFSLASDDASVLSVEQSADGANFDTVKDANGDAVTLSLVKTETSATLNIAELVTVWIRFSVEFAADETGSISGVTILSY